ncbi:hypothetical protein OG205_20450 [Lentzea sp. NBC_00516]|uniref:hypothetical protein n=1 Tax=Lentzea sp. NBC_00516 TaxID=2903582 RepID=UPI002E820040|nr:hypothetical protein [Lentzea sp. NBC_00516]WUD29291.1 hypothetical protein OG205_20450 [Lentzea sp. NBC_00516]
MSLFSPTPDLMPAVLIALVNDDRYARRKLAREQESLLNNLGADERLVAVGVDVTWNSGVTVVTTTRVFQLKRGEVINEASASRIRGTELVVRPNGNYFVSYEGCGLYVTTFLHKEEADRLCRAVDGYLVGAPPGERDIPDLFPDFYLGILRDTGKPETAENVVELVDRTRRAVAASGALAFFKQANDERARAQFHDQFMVDRGQDGETLLRMPDQMIDFLWHWNPVCHEPLRRMIARFHELMTGPDSFLWECGDEIPRWDDED